MHEVEAGPHMAVAKYQRSQNDALGQDVVDASPGLRLFHSFLGIDDHVVLRHILVALPVVGVVLFGLDLAHYLLHAVAGDNVVDGAVAAAAGEVFGVRFQRRQLLGLVVVKYGVFMVQVSVVHLPQHLVLVGRETPDLVVAVVAGLEIARPDFHQVDVAVSHGALAGEDAVRGIEEDGIPHFQRFDLLRQVGVLKLGDVPFIAASNGGRFLAGKVNGKDLLRRRAEGQRSENCSKSAKQKCFFHILYPFIDCSLFVYFIKMRQAF